MLNRLTFNDNVTVMSCDIIFSTFLANNLINGKYTVLEEQQTKQEAYKDLVVHKCNIAYDILRLMQKLWLLKLKQYSPTRILN